MGSFHTGAGVFTFCDLFTVGPPILISNTFLNKRLLTIPTYFAWLFKPGSTGKEMISSYKKFCCDQNSRARPDSNPHSLLSGQDATPHTTGAVCSHKIL